jgi:hypothetical protein
MLRHNMTAPSLTLYALRAFVQSTGAKTSRQDRNISSHGNHIRVSERGAISNFPEVGEYRSQCTVIFTITSKNELMTVSAKVTGNTLWSNNMVKFEKVAQTREPYAGVNILMHYAIFHFHFVELFNENVRNQNHARCDHGGLFCFIASYPILCTDFKM